MNYQGIDTFVNYRFCYVQKLKISGNVTNMSDAVPLCIFVN